MASFMPGGSSLGATLGRFIRGFAGSVPNSGAGGPSQLQPKTRAQGSGFWRAWQISERPFLQTSSWFLGHVCVCALSTDRADPTGLARGFVKSRWPRAFPPMTCRGRVAAILRTRGNDVGMAMRDLIGSVLRAHRAARRVVRSDRVFLGGQYSTSHRDVYCDHRRFAPHACAREKGAHVTPGPRCTLKLLARGVVVLVNLSILVSVLETSCSRRICVRQ